MSSGAKTISTDWSPEAMKAAMRSKLEIKSGEYPLPAKVSMQSRWCGRRRMVTT